MIGARGLVVSSFGQPGAPRPKCTDVAVSGTSVLAAVAQPRRSHARRGRVHLWVSGTSGRHTRAPKADVCALRATPPGPHFAPRLRVRNSRHASGRPLSH